MTAPWRPVVTVVVPMLDEMGFIDACLDGFADQTYPVELLDVVVLDGGSTDGSRELVDERARASGWLRVVDNPDRRASAAFNLGVEVAKGQVVCLFSSHGVPESTYVERSVDVLAETGVAGVGGQYDHVGLDPASSAIGLAMVSPFGMASPHRFATARVEVDTISHPAYRREVLAEVGGFDVTLLRNSDYELNHRLRAAGHALLFDPSIRSVYRPRGSLQALGRQFWWYGRWKARVVRRHPDSLRARHLAPPMAALGAMATPLLIRRRAGRRIVGSGAGAYLVGLALAVRRTRPAEAGAHLPTLAAAFPVMHLAWGVGLLTGAVEELLERRSR